MHDTHQPVDGNGSPASYDACFDELAAIAYRVAFRIVGQRDEALDLAQEAMARAFARWRRVHPHAPAWVTRITTNLALDVVRKRSRTRTLFEETRSATPDPSTALVTRAELIAILERLP